MMKRKKDIIATNDSLNYRLFKRYFELSLF